ncbi:DNA-methyltransferase [Phascolarctobacterium sp.]
MNKIICGDALTVLRRLPDKCCRCCVTSPPYFNLRDYGVPGQIGLEPTMQEYIVRLVEVFAEVKRVLTDDGTLWVNIADSYSGSGKGAALYPENAKKYKQGTNTGSCGVAAITKNKYDLPNKNLMGIPWRLAFALQDSGWILRQDIIWSKSNCMPESVRDRCTKSHEYIFLFAKRQRYYFNSEGIKEPIADSTIDRLAQDLEHQSGSARAHGGVKTMKAVGGSRGAFGGKQSRHRGNQELTAYRNKRSVWNMPTASCGKNNYATFPDELAVNCILAGTAEGDIVLDPFVGSGTTCRVANRYGRRYIGIDLNSEYCKAAEAEIPINLF